MNFWRNFNAYNHLKSITDKKHGEDDRKTRRAVMKERREERAQSGLARPKPTLPPICLVEEFEY
jgi:hypothetical protein